MPNGAAIKSPPLVLGDDTIVIADMEGTIIALDGAVGSLRWQVNLEDAYTGFSRRGPQFAVDGRGRLIINLMAPEAGGIIALGGDGGCAAGTEANFTARTQSELCVSCAIGEFQPLTGAGPGTCAVCEKGTWSDQPKSTFCFLCASERWCKGGDECLDGRGGAAWCARAKLRTRRVFLPISLPLKWSTPLPSLALASAVCAEQFYSLRGTCNECPESTLLAWVVTFCFVMVLLLLCFNIFLWAASTGYSNNTCFTRDLRSDDDDGDDDDAETAECELQVDVRVCPSWSVACFGLCCLAV